MCGIQPRLAKKWATAKTVAQSRRIPSPPSPENRLEPLSPSRPDTPDPPTPLPPPPSPGEALSCWSGSPQPTHLPQRNDQSPPNSLHWLDSQRTDADRQSAAAATPPPSHKAPPRATSAPPPCASPPDWPRA